LAILLLGKSESDHYLNPAQAKISWILKDKDNVEKDYEHFSCPFILSVNQVQKKIRNLKYRYIKDGTLFPEEVEQYDPYIIRESLNNCIAHQDYSLNGKINVVEREDGILVFSNAGAFIPESVEQVIEADAPESRYRNPFLSNAMVNLNLIDTIGSGIKRMYNIQRNKFFPLPDYDLGKLSVKVTIIGKILDTKYAVKLAQMPNLSLHEIILLDKVSKSKSMTEFEIKELKDKQLIEGRKPNFHISAEVAIATGEKSDYLKQRGIDDGYCQKMILNYLEKFGEGKREDFESLLLDKLPDVLDIIQKRNKIKNNLQTLRKQGKIDIKGKIWKMSKPE
jgi:ATP-dependent DNA helicase RecG